MEKQSLPALIAIHADIAIAEQRKRDPLWSYAKENGERSRALFEKAFGILSKYGKDRQKTFPNQRIDYLETPPVATEVNGREFGLTIADNIAPYGKDAIYKKDAIVVRSTSLDSPEETPKQLFLINQFGLGSNWIGKPAEIDHVKMMSDVLELIEDSLSKNSTPELQRPSSGKPTDVATGS